MPKYFVFVVDSGFQNPCGFQYEVERPPEYFKFVEEITKRVNAMKTLPYDFFVRNPNPGSGKEDDDSFIEVERLGGPFGTEAEGRAFGEGLLMGRGEFCDSDFVVVSVNDRLNTQS